MFLAKKMLKLYITVSLSVKKAEQIIDWLNKGLANTEYPFACKPVKCWVPPLFLYNFLPSKLINFDLSPTLKGIL